MKRILHKIHSSPLQRLRNKGNPFILVPMVPPLISHPTLIPIIPPHNRIVKCKIAKINWSCSISISSNNSISCHYDTVLNLNYIVTNRCGLHPLILCILGIPKWRILHSFWKIFPTFPVFVQTRMEYQLSIRGVVLFIISFPIPARVECTFLSDNLHIVITL